MNRSTTRGWHRSLVIFRRGFTVIELLVAMGVIGILVALLLPAVQSARATARLADCRSRLHQIGVAAHQSESTDGKLDTLRPMVSLLPAMGNAPLHHDFTVNDGNGLQWGRHLVAGTQFSPYLCPDLAPERPLTFNYLINRNLCENGGYGEGCRFRNVTDGLSQTAMFSERLVPLGVLHGDAPNMPIEAAAIPLRFQWYLRQTVQDFNQFASACADSNQRIDAERGSLLSEQQMGSHNFEGWYKHTTPPNGFSCHNQPSVNTPQPPWITTTPNLLEQNGLMYFSAAPSSTHAGSGGVNVLMCDGSVHFVTNGIDLALWRAIGTQNGNDRVGEF